jgi:hypothetical protein
VLFNSYPFLFVYLKAQLADWVENYTGYRRSESQHSVFVHAVEGVRQRGVEVVLFVPAQPLNDPAPRARRRYPPAFFACLKNWTCRSRLSASARVR